MNPANYCLYYMNIVSIKIKTSNPCIFSIIYSNKNAVLLNDMWEMVAYKKCVLTIQIESSIYKFVQ